MDKNTRSVFDSGCGHGAHKNIFQPILVIFYKSKDIEGIVFSISIVARKMFPSTLGGVCSVASGDQEGFDCECDKSILYDFVHSKNYPDQESIRRSVLACNNTWTFGALLLNTNFHSMCGSLPAKQWCIGCRSSSWLEFSI